MLRFLIKKLYCAMDSSNQSHQLQHFIFLMFVEDLDYDEVYRETESTNCTVYVGGIPANCSGNNHFNLIHLVQSLPLVT